MVGEENEPNSVEMTSNSFEKPSDPVIIAKILQGFCQSFNENELEMGKAYGEQSSKRLNEMSNSNLFDTQDCESKRQKLEGPTFSTTYDNHLQQNSGFQSFCQEIQENPIANDQQLSNLTPIRAVSPIASPVFAAPYPVTNNRYLAMPLQHIVHLPSHRSITTMYGTGIDSIQHRALKFPADGVQQLNLFNNNLFSEENPSKTMHQFPTPMPCITSNQNKCRMLGCNEFSAKRTPYCLKHSGVRKCESPSCKKYAQGQTRYCIAHGGGRRCCFTGCSKAARDRKFCAGHGGGKRCGETGCPKIAVGGSNFCTRHGGGKRCEMEGCHKAAQSGGSNFCVKHGGGKKCSIPGCLKVARGKTAMCMAHGKCRAA